MFSTDSVDGNKGTWKTLTAERFIRAISWCNQANLAYRPGVCRAMAAAARAER
jgi:hypothetical protein